MKQLCSVLALLVIAGCVPLGRHYWDPRAVVLSPADRVALLLNNKAVLEVDKRTLQKLFLTHARITRAAGVQAQLLLFDGDDPNAFAGYVNSRRIIAINIGMMKLIGDHDDEFAALLSHETAHWARGHVDAAHTRSSTIQAIGTVVGGGLGMAGVPAAGVISGLGAGIVESSFSRGDEREADIAGIDYIIAVGANPWAAVRLHEKLLSHGGGGFPIPFLSTHPSSSERIEYLKKTILEKTSAAIPSPAAE